jgi:RHS repeat-associated protein
VLAFIGASLLLSAGAAQAQSLSASPASLYSSQSLTATWSDIAAPTAADWIGLYPAGAADNAFVVWRYTDGSASGSAPLTVPANAAAGSYELRLFSNNGYTKLATSNSVTVQTPPAATLGASPATLYSGQSLSAAWGSIFAPSASDWIGLYPAGAADNAFVVWRNTDGSASGSAPLTVPANAAAGSYELRLFSNNGYTKLATSNGITVQTPPPATLSASPSALAPGGTLNAAWTYIPAPSANDWVGLYALGAADNAFVVWRYTDGSAAGSAPLTVPANAAAGSYELRLFSNNGYTRLATSGHISVGSATVYFIHVDHLNTPRLIVNNTGTTVWRWDQGEPFGNDVPNNNPSGAGAFDFPLRFPGQYFDRETNLAYNYYRDLDPNIGRYIQSDPTGLAGGLNTYLYVDNNPLSDTDPEGLQKGGIQLTWPVPYTPPQSTSAPRYDPSAAPRREARKEDRDQQRANQNSVLGARLVCVERSCKIPQELACTPSNPSGQSRFSSGPFVSVPGAASQLDCPCVRTAWVVP